MLVRLASNYPAENGKFRSFHLDQELRTVRDGALVSEELLLAE
jgi:hypothetical protein